jgi:hypothetical protein
MDMRLASERIRACEGDLRQMVASAAGSGDYEAVLRLTSCAKQLIALADSVGSNGSSLPSAPPQPAAKSDTPNGRNRAKPARAEPYPRFYSQRDHLIRVGRSRRGGAEYQHKTPKAAVDSIVSSVLVAGRDGKVFTMEDCLPFTQDSGNKEIPSYQAYNVMAWLKKMNLVDQHGRQGYSIRDADHFGDKVAQAWGALSAI